MQNAIKGVNIKKRVFGRGRMSRVGNILLRMLTMAGRFILVFSMAKFMHPADVGRYGLLAATVGLGVTFLGFEFHQYVNREVMGGPSRNWASHLLNHLTALTMIYLIAIPVCAVLFALSGLPAEMMLPFFLILVLEHLTQEMFRTLIAMQDQASATLVLFMRSALWIFIVIPSMYAGWISASLSSILMFWMAGLLFAFSFGLWGVLRHLERPLRPRINREFLKKGFKVSILFVLGGACSKLLFTGDRYIVEYINGNDILAAYVVFSGMAMSMLSVLEASAFSFLYPKIVASWRNRDWVEYKRLKKELWLSVVVSLCIMIVGIMAITPLFLQWIDRPIYYLHVELLWFLLAIVGAYCLGVIPQYQLYAFGEDRLIVLTHVVAAAIFFPLAFLLAHIEPLTAVPVALLGALIIQFVLRVTYVSRIEADSATNAS